MKINVVVGVVHGIAENIEGEGFITIDPRQSQKEMLITAIHEGLHLVFPLMEEAEVETASIIISAVPWKLGYRRKAHKVEKKNKIK